MSRIFDSLKKVQEAEKSISQTDRPTPALGTIGIPPRKMNVAFATLILFFLAVCFAGAAFVMITNIRFNRVNDVFSSQQKFLDKVVAQVNQANQKLESMEEKNKSVAQEVSRFSKGLEKEKDERVTADEKQEKQIEQNDRFLRAWLDESLASLSRQIGYLEERVEEENYLPEAVPSR